MAWARARCFSIAITCECKKFDSRSVWVSSPSLSVLITQPTVIEWQNSIHRSVTPPKFWPKKEKTTTKVTLTSHQKSDNELCLSFSSCHGNKTSHPKCARVPTSKKLRIKETRKQRWKRYEEIHGTWEDHRMRVSESYTEHKSRFLLKCPQAISYTCQSKMLITNSILLTRMKQIDLSLLMELVDIDALHSLGLMWMKAWSVRCHRYTLCMEKGLVSKMSQIHPVHGKRAGQ